MALPKFLYYSAAPHACNAQWRSHWGQGGQSATPDNEKFAKYLEKEGKNQEKSEKRGKIGKKGKNRKGSFTLPFGLATLLAMLTHKLHVNRVNSYLTELRIFDAVVLQMIISVGF